MALKGTLKDFGIADILQLIGQQQKTGTLQLKTKVQEVFIGFNNGFIVKAESATRKKKDLIGAMLVRAELISEAQLETALETQKRTLKRLGDVLVSTKLVSAERFKQMVQLQITETLYGLFLWKSGTYAFTNGDLEVEDGVSPLRAENVLMEGFRMVDEWPQIKKTITGYTMTFERVRALPAPVKQEVDLDDAFDDAFAEKKKDENKGEFKSIGDSERTIFELIRPDRDARKLIDLGRLGEFETAKALCNLVNLQYVRALYPEGQAPADDGSTWMSRVSRRAAQVAVTAVILGFLAWIGSHLSWDTLSGSDKGTTFSDPAAQRFISRNQESRISAALEVYRLEKGALPESLGALVDAQLLTAQDVRYPWRDPYYYRRISTAEFVLLPPLR